MIRKKGTNIIILCILLFVFLSVTVLNNCYAQVIPPKEEWARTFGGIEDDWANDVQQTSDGGYIIVGSTSQDDLFSDCLLVKTDSNGNEQWSRTFGEIRCGVNSVQQTNDNGYILAGYTRRYGAVFFNLLLLKTNSNGIEQWNKSFGGMYENIAYSVQQTLDGGYIIGGYTESVDSLDFLLVKTDPNGSEQWKKTFGGIEDDWLYSVQQTSDGGYILAGENGNDCVIMKTDSKGNKQWDKIFGGIGGDYADSIQQTSDGGFIFAGGSEKYAKGMDFWLVKIDSNGNKQWEKKFGGINGDYARSVQQTSDGGYIIAGETNSYGAGSWDFWLIKTDSIGNKIWNQSFGGLGDDSAESVRQTLDDGYIIAGGTESYGSGKNDFWLIKLEKEPIINEEISIQNINYQDFYLSKDEIDEEFLEESLETLNILTKLNSHNATYWYYKGNVLELLQQSEEAILAYNKAIEINPEYTEAWTDKAFSLYILGRYDEALDCFEIAIEIDPEYAMAWFLKGSLLYELGEYENSLIATDKAIEINPELAEAWHNKGNALLSLGRYKEALRANEKAIEINPDYAISWYGKAISLYKMGRYDEALDCYEKAIEIYPEFADAWHGRGAALSELDQNIEAIISYEKAIEIDPGNEGAWNDKGVALYELGRYDEALSCFEKAIEIDPEFADAWSGKGVILEEMGRQSEANIAFEKAYELDPTLRIPQTHGFDFIIGITIVFTVVYYLKKKY